MVRRPVRPAGLDGVRHRLDALVVEGLQAAGGVADAEFHAPVVEGAGGEGADVLTQGADDERVEFGNDDAREARVF